MKLVHETHEGALYMNDSHVIKILNTDKLDETDIENVLKVSVLFSEKIPNYVPKVYSTCKIENGVAIYMEKLQGMTLNQYIDSLTTRDYSPDEIFKVVMALCNATSALHDLGYVHGDLHESNVIVDPQLNIKFVDFTQSDVITAVDPGDMETLQLYHEQIYISTMIAKLIFMKKHPTVLNKSVYDIINQISNYTVDDVVGGGKTANKLFNILNVYRQFWVFLD